MMRNAKQLKRTAALLLVLALLLGSVPAALAETFSAVVTSGEMEVYRDKKLTSPMGSLQKYTVVRVSSYSDGIARITFNGITGYAATSDMQTVASFARRALTAAASKVYASPSRGAASVNIAKGAKLYVLALNDGWALVEMNGNVGYIEADRLAEADESWQRIEDDEDEADDIEYQVAALDASTAITGTATANAKVYRNASTRSTKLGTLKKGVSVKVLAYNRTWAYIELNGHRGYCLVKYLKRNAAVPVVKATPTPKAIGTVSVAKLPVYKTASTKSKKLGTLKKGRTVNMISWSGKWAYIELNGKYGYAALSGLKRSSIAAAPTPAPTAAPTPVPSLDNAIKAVVSDSSVTVFQGSTTGSAILGIIPQGTEVNLVAAEGEWAYIERSGHYGYCKLSALSRISEEDSGEDELKDYKKESFTATVVVAGAKAYSKPNTASDSVALGLGASVSVTAYSGQWACITHGGSYAFVPVAHLSRTAYDTIAESGATLQTLLKALLSYGYFDGAPSTNYNSAAITAIQRFQAACGLSQTGKADQTMQRILYSGYAPVSSMLTTPLSKGAKSANVTRLQTRLYTLGYFSKAGSVDGDYGTKTASAVTLFQNANGITATGRADTATLRSMYASSAISRPSGVKAADDTTATSIPTPRTTSTYMTYMPGNTAGKVTSYSAGLTNAQKLEYAIYVASTKLTCPYVYGAVGPSKFDCSGLTQYCFKAIGVSLLRTAYQQGYNNNYPKIEGVGNLRRGDLVFFNTVSDSDLSDHVGIYLGSGYFIHASSGGHKVVCSQLASGYYNRVFSWGRRILP